MKPAGNKTDIPNPHRGQGITERKGGSGSWVSVRQGWSGLEVGASEGGTEEGSRGRRCHLPNPTQIHFVQTFLKVERVDVLEGAVQDHGRCLQELETQLSCAVGVLALTGGAAQAPAQQTRQSRAVFYVLGFLVQNCRLPVGSGRGGWSETQRHPSDRGTEGRG